MTVLDHPPEHDGAPRASQPPPQHSTPHAKSHEAHEVPFEIPHAAHASRLRIAVIAVLVVGALLTVFLLRFLPKLHAQEELAANTKSAGSALSRVSVMNPKRKSSDHAMVLPGSVQALEETIVYARASGYVRKWNVDIGDKVKEGDVLVEVDTPEIDQQLSQARAQLLQAQAGLAQATANRNFSTTNLDRYKDLAPKGVASQQELDQHQAQSTVDQANVQVAQATIDAQQANVHRLNDLKSFSRVTAPFGGMVNTRMIARGDLVSPTTPLYKISSVDPVRVFVQVPQDIAPSVRADVPAHVTVPEYGGRVFEGKVARMAGSLDATSRTMNVEVRLPNPKGELLVGMYARVGLTLPSPHSVLEVPATALLNDAKGLRVAIVGPDGKIRLASVIIERDTGPTVEISSGIDENDRIVKLASADLADGKSVEVVP